jgi:hypothetical protein
MYQRDKLLSDLRNNAIEVHFTKVNGENRAMRCTLMPRLLPESYVKSLEEQESEKGFHNKNPDVIAAWDLEKAAWRSFKINSVTYCQVLDNY